MKPVVGAEAVMATSVEEHTAVRWLADEPGTVEFAEAVVDSSQRSHVEITEEKGYVEAEGHSSFVAPEKPGEEEDS